MSQPGMMQPSVMSNGGALPSMPPGIGQTQSNPGTNTPSTVPTPPGGNGFSPPFKFGQGKTGVFTDPRSQIAGSTSGNLQPANTANPTTPPVSPAPSAGNIGGSGTLNGGGDSSNSSPIPNLGQ